MPKFNTLRQMMNMPDMTDEREKEIQQLKEDPKRLAELKGQILDDRLKMASNEENQGPRLPMLGVTPAEEAAAESGLDFATAGTMSSLPSKTLSQIEKATLQEKQSLSDLIKNLAKQRADRLKSQGLGNVEEAQKIGKHLRKK